MGLIGSGSLSCFFGPRRQFADVIAFDQIEIRVVIENHLCFDVADHGYRGVFPPSGTCLQPDRSLSRTPQWGELDDQT